MTSDEALHQASDREEDDRNRKEEIPPSERALSPGLGSVSDVLPQISKQLLDFDRSQSIGQVLADITRQFQANAEVFNAARKPLQDFARAARIAFEPFVRVVQEWERFGAAVQKTLEPIQRIREAFLAIPPEQLSAFQRAIATFSEDIRFGWDIVEAPVFQLFADLGLTGLESHLTRSELLHVLKLSEATGKKSVLDYLFRKFRKDKFRILNSIVRSWWSLPYMRKRKKAVRAAISAHKNRQYELTIPALLPLIDGLAAEIVSATPKLRKKAIYAKDAATLYHLREAEVWSECVEQVVCL